MAYFSNGSEGGVFDEECSTCVYGEKPCPIALVQVAYNYDAVNNEVATKILDNLVKNNGTCEMKKMSKNFNHQKENATLVSLDELEEIHKGFNSGTKTNTDVTC